MNAQTQRRTKYYQIRNHLLDWMKRSSPMLWARLETKLINEDWALKLFAGSRLRLNQQVNTDMKWDKDVCSIADQSTMESGNYSHVGVELNKGWPKERDKVSGQIPMWEASDGELFRDEATWTAYEASLAEAKSIDSWIAAEAANGEPFPKAQATRAKTLVLKYLAWKSAQG